MSNEYLCGVSALHEVPLTSGVAWQTGNHFRPQRRRRARAAAEEVVWNWQRKKIHFLLSAMQTFSLTANSSTKDKIKEGVLNVLAKSVYTFSG